MHRGIVVFARVLVALGRSLVIVERHAGGQDVDQRESLVAHRGTSMIDVISPCVTFNDHEGSTKSYAYVKDHEEPLGEISFVPYFEDINVEYDAGSTTSVTMHDGSHLLLRKIAEDYNPSDKMAAIRLLHDTLRRGEFATGVIYIEPDKDDFIDTLNIVDTPLAFLTADRVRPPKAALDEIMDGLR
jgi:2-oxoglutarate ferredoxin oxidoreductase subunit beta